MDKNKKQRKDLDSEQNAREVSAPTESLVNTTHACTTTKENRSERTRTITHSSKTNNQAHNTKHKNTYTAHTGSADFPASTEFNSPTDVTPVVAILVDNLHSYQKYVCNTIDLVLRASGYRSIIVVLSSHDLERSALKEQPKSLLSRLLHQDYIDGVIALNSSVGANMSSEEFQNVIDQINAVPVVYHGCAVHNSGSDAAVLNNESAMNQLFEHIATDPTRRKFCFVRGFGNQSDSKRLEFEFKRCLATRNLPVIERYFLNGNYREADAYNEVTALLKSGEVPDAIVAANDNMAVSALRAVQAFGLHVPTDLVVTGFDDRKLASECDPPLTTIRVDLAEHARKTANLIIDRIQDTQSTQEPSNTTRRGKIELIENLLIVRESTGGFQTPSDNSSDKSESENLEKSYQHAVSAIVAVLDRDMQQKQTTQLELSSRFIKTLNYDSDAFETVIDDLHTEVEHEFDGYNVLYELHSTIGTLLMVILQLNNTPAGFKRLTKISNELSKLVYDEQAKRTLTTSRNQQIYDKFQSGILQSRTLENVLLVLDTALAQYMVPTAMLILPNKLALFGSPSQQKDSTHYLVYARTKCNNEFVNLLNIPQSSFLPDQYQRTVNNEGLLIHPVSINEEDFGYLLIDIATLESTAISKITTCLTAAIVNCNQLAEQKQYTEQLRSINLELARKTNYDSTTGLPIRKQFLATVNQSLYEYKPGDDDCLVMLITLNDLKHFGLQTETNNADKLLHSLATQLVSNAGSGRPLQVFRTGSADFAIIMHGEPNELPQDSIDSIMQTLHQTFNISGHRVKVSPYVGIAVYPQHGFDSEELVNNATIALNAALDRSSIIPVIYDSTLNRAGINKWQLDQKMRDGLANNEFCLHYQPRVDASTGKIASFEALLRWFSSTDQNEKDAQIGPAVFIPIAEETGLIVELGEFVLNAACKQLQKWQKAGIDTRLSVNLSTKELDQPDLLNRIEKTLANHRLESSSIELEVTESAAMLNIETNIAKLGELQEQGFAIAIDDFGTDYSSLNYLKRLPANYLKIDRSFIMDIDEADGGDCVDAAIVKAIVALGHSLGHKIVAEGVETQMQLAFLQSLQVEQIQGYFFSAPVDANKAQQMLIDQRKENSINTSKKAA